MQVIFYFALSVSNVCDYIMGDLHSNHPLNMCQASKIRSSCEKTTRCKTDRLTVAFHFTYKKLRKMTSYATFYECICDDLRRNNNLRAACDEMTTAKNDDERIRILFRYKCIPEFIAPITSTDNLKCPDRSEKILEKAANDKNDLATCLKHLNAAAFLAPHPKLDVCQEKSPPIAEVHLEIVRHVKDEPDVMTYPLLCDVYRLRSEILFFLGFHQECLWDIARTLNLNANQHGPQLISRAARCLLNQGKPRAASVVIDSAVHWAAELSQVRSEVDAVLKKTPKKKKDVQSVDRLEIPKLADGRNKYITSASRVVTLNNSSTKGRYLVATRDIAPGEILIVEKAYATTLLTPFFATHCCHCCRRTVAPLPCHQCSNVGFCGEECRMEAWRTYHQYECLLLEELSSPSIGKMSLLAFRIVTRAGLHALEVDNLKVLGLDNVFDSADYLPVYNQVTNSAHRAGADMLKRSITAVYLSQCLFAVGFHSKRLPGLLLRHLQSCACNSYEITETVMKKNQDSASPSWRRAQGIEIGGAAYPAISLSNHACFANAMRTSYGSTCILRAARPICKGEEITDNYGFFFETQDVSERQDGLRRHYQFDCDCIACNDSWKIFDSQMGDCVPYRCPKCKSASVASEWTLWNKCSICKVDLRPLARKLESSSKAFRRACSSDDRNQLLQTSVQLLTLLSKVVSRPNRNFVECYQIAKLCWNLQGSKYEE